MFEFEIMLTGYTALVATTTTLICKRFQRKELQKTRNELDALKETLQEMELEIKLLQPNVE